MDQLLDVYGNLPEIITLLSVSRIEAEHLALRGIVESCQSSHNAETIWRILPAYTWIMRRISARAA